MGGMGGVSERKEVEELVRECRDRMGEFFNERKSLLDRTEPPSPNSGSKSS